MNINFEDYGVVCLAGGAGQRMGGINKFNISYQGSTYGEIIKEQLRAVSQNRFVSSANYKYEYRDDFEEIRDCVFSIDGGFLGPVGGIYSSLLKLNQKGLKGGFFVSCDMPLFQKDIFYSLSEYVNKNDIVLVRTKDGHVHYTCGYYSVSILPVINSLIERQVYRIKFLIDECNSIIIDSNEHDINDEWFSNINHVSDTITL